MKRTSYSRAGEYVLGRAMLYDCVDRANGILRALSELVCA